MRPDGYIDRVYIYWKLGTHHFSKIISGIIQSFSLIMIVSNSKHVLKDGKIN
jgi:hypothetical protein